MIISMYSYRILIVYNERLVIVLDHRHHVATHNIVFTCYELYRLCQCTQLSFPSSLRQLNVCKLRCGTAEPRVTEHSDINGITTSGHYTYRTVITICTAQWSLYVPPSDHYMYRTVVTICTAQCSLYVPHSGHYTYRTVVTIRAAQRSLYVPPSDHYMYRTVVNIRTAQ